MSTDAVGTITGVSQQMEALTGYTREEAAAEHLR